MSADTVTLADLVKLTGDVRGCTCEPDVTVVEPTPRQRHLYVWHADGCPAGEARRG